DACGFMAYAGKYVLPDRRVGLSQHRLAEDSPEDEHGRRQPAAPEVAPRFARRVAGEAPGVVRAGVRVRTQALPARQLRAVTELLETVARLPVDAHNRDTAGRDAGDAQQIDPNERADAA